MDIHAIEQKAKADSAFLAALCESTTEEQIIRLCAENDLEITREEATQLLDGFDMAKNMDVGDELAEDDLDNVAGGFAVTSGTLVAIGVGLYLLYKAGKKVGEALGKLRDKLFG